MTIIFCSATLKVILIVWNLTRFLGTLEIWRLLHYQFSSLANCWPCTSEIILIWHLATWRSFFTEFDWIFGCVMNTWLSLIERWHWHVTRLVNCSLNLLLLSRIVLYPIHDYLLLLSGSRPVVEMPSYSITIYFISKPSINCIYLRHLDYSLTVGLSIWILEYQSLFWLW